MFFGTYSPSKNTISLVHGTTTEILDKSFTMTENYCALLYAIVINMTWKLF